MLTVLPRNSEVVHYWGVAGGEKRLVVCTKIPNLDWKTTGSLLRVTCPKCLELLHKERLH